MSFTMCSQPIGQEPGVNGCVAWEKLEGVEGGQGGRGCLARSALVKLTVSWRWLLGLETGERQCGVVAALLGPHQTGLYVVRWLEWSGAGLPCESVSGQALLWCLGYFVKHQEIMDRAFDF